MESLFQLSAVMPVQYLKKRLAPVEGERRLMLAVLEDGVFSYQRNGVSRRCDDARRKFELDQAWLDSYDRDSLFSFENICDTFGFDAGALRTALHASVQGGQRGYGARTPRIVTLKRTERLSA